jgi:hypothetical protein
VNVEALAHWGAVAPKEKQIKSVFRLHSRHFNRDNFWIGSWEISKPVRKLRRSIKFTILAVNRNLVVQPIENDYTDNYLSL